MSWLLCPLATSRPVDHITIYGPVRTVTSCTGEQCAVCSVQCALSGEYLHTTSCISSDSGSVDDGCDDRSRAFCSATRLVGSATLPHSQSLPRAARLALLEQPSSKIVFLESFCPFLFSVYAYSTIDRFDSRSTTRGCTFEQHAADPCPAPSYPTMLEPAQGRPGTTIN